jgi:hypothetical protein
MMVVAELFGVVDGLLFLLILFSLPEGSCGGIMMVVVDGGSGGVGVVLEGGELGECDSSLMC